MKKHRHFRRNALMTLLLISLSLFTQAYTPTQQAEVRSVVDMLFKGMRTGDSAMIRSVFLPGAWMSSLLKNAKDSLIIRHEDSIDKFVKAVGTPHREKFDEQIYDVKILLDDPVAMVWAPYKFYLGKTFSHCGVNVFTMIKTAQG
jgi:hypothetical protein